MGKKIEANINKHYSFIIRFDLICQLAMCSMICNVDYSPTFQG